jgi:hypothetical protein
MIIFVKKRAHKLKILQLEIQLEKQRLKQKSVK